MAEKIIFENVTDFDPNQIFDCGQCFRWEPVESNCTGAGGDRLHGHSFGSSSMYRGVVGNRIGLVTYDFRKSRLVVFDSMLATGECTVAQSRKFWHHYFDLDRNYSAIKKKLSRGDGVMKAAIKEGSGIRILNQDPWETLISFIISQNNNIPRIKGCIENLTRVLGENLGYSSDGRGLYSFPKPETLAKAEPADLAPCRLGYRDKYLIEAARQYLEWGMPEDAEGLLKFSGVGPKVANCIALFGMGLIDSFPIDVWMRRVMNRLYEIPEEDIKGMTAFAQKNFAPYGGIAQQYLFYYITHKGVDKPFE